MNFKSILTRLTGISCPIFGISWNPPESERKIAKDVILFLEDRRVLYIPSEMESPEYCIRSVLDIRIFLTGQLQRDFTDEILVGYLQAMRIACRKFLDRMSRNERKVQNFLHHASSWGHFASWEFASALGEMRGTFGVILAQIAASYGTDIGNDLASIVPGEKLNDD